MSYNYQRKWLTVKEKDKEHHGEDLNEQKTSIVLCHAILKSVAWHDTKTLHGAGKLRWSKIINMPFFPKSFNWFTMQSKVQKSALDSRTRTRTSRRFDCPFLAKILRLILLFVSSTGCSVILVAGNWTFLLIEKCHVRNCYRVHGFFWKDNIFAKPRTKMTTVSRFSHQNDVGLHALSVVLRENFVLVVVLVVVLVLESKAH